MSAPETNTEKQKKRHKTPLAGMGIVTGFALVLLVALIAFLSINGNEPADNEPVAADAIEPAVEGETAPAE